MSSTISEKFDSPSPTGPSSDTGSSIMRWSSITRSAGSFSSAASSATSGSRPSCWVSMRLARCSFLMTSSTCSGRRIVRAWSAIARDIDWRIHQVAYVESL